MNKNHLKTLLMGVLIISFCWFFFTEMNKKDIEYNRSIERHLIIEDSLNNEIIEMSKKLDSIDFIIYQNDIKIDSLVDEISCRNSDINNLKKRYRDEKNKIDSFDINDDVKFFKQFIKRHKKD